MGKLGKHDHKLTNLLKGGIFSLIMLAPLIAIGVSCLYVVNNKNAYESYYGDTINNKEVVNGYNDLETYYNYQFALATVDTGNIAYSVNDVKIVAQPNAYNFQQTLTNNVKELYVYYSNNIHYTRIQYNDNSYQYVQNLTTVFEGLVLSFYLNTKPNNNAFEDYISYNKYNNYSYLDNVFYYSIHNLEEQETFNWVQNTAIYVPLNAMCSGLGITESAIPILLCYWSLITAIYIVFDIIIYLFTKMTHFIGTN